MKKILVPLARVTISGLLLWVVYRNADAEVLRRILTSDGKGLLLLVFAMLFANTLLNAVRWREFLRAADLDVPVLKLTASMLIGSFFNTFLPSNIGGDFYRVYDVARKTARPADALASVFASRLAGFFGLALVGTVFGLWGIEFLPHPLFALLPVTMLLFLLALLWAFLQQRLVRWGMTVFRLNRIAKIEQFYERFLTVFTLYRRHPRCFTDAVGIGLVFQISVIFCIYLLARYLGVEAWFFYFCVFVPMISIVEALPITVFGLGLRDGAYVLFFTQVGVSKSAALSMAVLYVLVSVCYSALGGLLLLRRTGARARARGAGAVGHGA